MTIVVPNVSEKSLLDKMIKESDEDYLMKLFKNNFVPDSTTVLSDFVEADFPGYAPRTLLRSDWTDAITEDKKAKTTHPVVSWECEGVCNNTIYGYFVVGKTTGDLLWSERFTVAKVLDTGDLINVFPAMTLFEQE